ncbi:MAG: DUF4968 domain-containing protein, partial [Ignavibacteria bacterium]|nr:DUF4968 domain-containing protein [Ignavibacteria bacterium]
MNSFLCFLPSLGGPIAMRPVILRSLLLITLLFGVLLPQSIGQTHDPLPDPRSVVVTGEVRFTVLTPQLIRMEWSAQGKFEDRPSLVVINRKLPVPPFQKKEDGGWLNLQTEKLMLRYKQGSGKFSQENLEISFDLDGRKVTWKPGLEDKGNLKGTIRTLDGVKGATELESGLVSRDGWVMVDDSQRPL